MVGEILEAYKNRVKSAELVPSSGGVFFVRADGTTLFSKHEEGRFPETDEIVKRLKQWEAAR